jgi:hypothetical protein
MDRDLTLKAATALELGFVTEAEFDCVVYHSETLGWPMP